MRSIPEDHIDNLLREPGVLPAHQRFLMSGTSLGAIMLAIMMAHRARCPGHVEAFLVPAMDAMALMKNSGADHMLLHPDGSFSVACCFPKLRRTSATVRIGPA